MAVAGKERNKHRASRSACLTRRGFLGAAAATGTLVLPPGRARSYAANEQLQVAVVGVGGRGSGFVVEKGWSSVHQQIGGRIAALCDVNQQKAAPDRNHPPSRHAAAMIRLFVPLRVLRGYKRTARVFL